MSTAIIAALTADTLHRPFCAWVNPSPGAPAGGGGVSGRCGWRWSLDSLVPAASVVAAAGTLLEAAKVQACLGSNLLCGKLCANGYVFMHAANMVVLSASIFVHHSVTLRFNCDLQEPVDVWERAARLRAMLSRIGAT